MSLGIGDETTDAFKDAGLLSYEGGNLYCLDDTSIEPATVLGVSAADTSSEISADPLGLGGIEHVPPPPQPTVLRPQRSRTCDEACCHSGSDDSSDGGGRKRWSQSAEGRAKEARARSRAEERQASLGPKLKPTFSFGDWSDHADSEPLKLGSDFPGPAP